MQQFSLLLLAVCFDFLGHTIATNDFVAESSSSLAIAALNVRGYDVNHLQARSAGGMHMGDDEEEHDELKLPRGSIAIAASKEHKQCTQLKSLTKLTQLASNATALAMLQAKENITIADIEKIKEKAALATTKLAMLSGNGTLVNDCAMMAAESELRKTCSKMKKLTKLSKLGTSSKALGELQKARQLTTAEMQKVKEVSANATAMLNAMMQNTTLKASCAALHSGKGKAKAKGMPSCGPHLRPPNLMHLQEKAKSEKRLEQWDLQQKDSALLEAVFLQLHSRFWFVLFWSKF